MTLSMRGRRGFTLLELVVALAITGMLAAAGAGAFNAVVDMRTRAREMAAISNAAAANRGLLVAWLSSGRVTLAVSSAPSMATMNFSDDDDQVIIIATASTPLNFGEVAIRLFIDRDDLTPEKGLVAEMQELQGLRTSRVQLDSVVTGLLAEALDNTTGLWVPRRNSAVRAPRAVRITFSTTAPDTLPALMRLPFVQPLYATTNATTPPGGAGR
jgi:prepilin-type N-terminal cleavage/methylation domain-containing protein